LKAAQALWVASSLDRMFVARFCFERVPYG